MSDLDHDLQLKRKQYSKHVVMMHDFRNYIVETISEQLFIYKQIDNV